MNRRWTIALSTLLVFAGVEMALLPTAAGAQKKGQAVKIETGRVIAMQQGKTQSSKASGAVVGGTIGLIVGGSSSKKRRRGAAAGAAVGAAVAPGSEVVMQYTVETASGAKIAIVSDQMEIRMGDCVVVEQSGDKANIRRISEEACQPDAAALLRELEEEFQEEAIECLAAKDELVAAQTDEAVDRALRKVSVLCDY